MTDTIGKDCVVGYRFSVRATDGELLAEDHVTHYLHGQGTSPAGLEQHMGGLKVGAKLSVTLAPKDAFGERQEQGPMLVTHDQFPEDAELEPGMRIFAETPGGNMSLWVADVNDEGVVLDPNHPLAGRELNFDVEIVSIRKATDDELAHGHAHEGEHAH